MTCQNSQAGWAIRLPGSLLKLALIFSVAFNAFAFSIAGDDKLGQHCLNKASYAKALILGRTEPGNHKAEMRDQIDKLAKQAREYENYPRYAQVDMESIIRRAYRINGGEYRTTDPGAFSAQIFKECATQGF